MRSQKMLICLMLFGVVTLFGYRILTDKINVIEKEGWDHRMIRDVSHYINTLEGHSPELFCANNDYLLVIVHSKPSNFENRNVIRKTWGQETKSLFFLLGETANATWQHQVDKESSLHRDIVQERFVDSYDNLTLKSVMMLRLAVTRCRHYKFLLKADDDTFVVVGNIMRLLAGNTSSLLVGKLMCNALPFRNPTSKYYVPAYLYGERTYPDYVTGGAYLMSMRVAAELYRAALKTPLVPGEDVYVTGICGKVAGIAPTHNELFAKKTKVLKTDDRCLLKKSCALFDVEVGEMLKLNEMLQRGGDCDVGGFSYFEWMLGNVVGLKDSPFRYRYKCRKSTTGSNFTSR